MKRHRNRDIDSALTSKGFQRTEGGSHTHYVFYYLGKPTRVVTFLSRGTDDPGESNLHKMKKQLFFNSPNDFDLFIECPYTEEEYINNLRSKGIIA